MVVFVILLLVPIVLQHVVIGERRITIEKKNQRAILAFFLILAVLVALRHERIGNDTSNYIYIFERISNMGWLETGKFSIEPGFALYNKIVSIFTKEPQVFLAVTAIATVAMIYPTYKRLGVDPSLTIMLFCTLSTFVMAFSGIRQMLAIGMGFLAYECTRRRKIVPYVICILLAVAFHTSAFMLAFMYPLYHARITKKWLLVVVPVVIAVFVFNEQLFGILSVFLERYTDYGGGVERTGAYTMIILFSLFAVFSFLIPEEASLDQETIGLRNFLLLSLVVQMFAPLHTLVMRMNYYYIIFIPLLLPKMIEKRSDRWNQVAIVARHVMVVFFLIYFFINARGEDNLHVFPYHFFWEELG